MHREESTEEERPPNEKAPRHRRRAFSGGSIRSIHGDLLRHRALSEADGEEVSTGLQVLAVQRELTRIDACTTYTTTGGVEQFEGEHRLILAIDAQHVVYWVRLNAQACSGAVLVDADGRSDAFATGHVCVVHRIAITIVTRIAYLHHIAGQVEREDHARAEVTHDRVDDRAAFGGAEVGIAGLAGRQADR